MLYYENKMWSSVLLPFVQLLTDEKETRPFYELGDVVIEEGDTVMSSHSPNIDNIKEINFEKVLDTENTYNDGITGISVLIQDALYHKTSKEFNSWVFKAVLGNDLILSALYSSYGAYVSKYISYSSYIETTNNNKLIILVYGEKLDYFMKEIKKVPLIKGRFRVVRYSYFVRFLKDHDTIDGITTIAIKSRLRNSYLFVQGKDIQDIRNLYGELKSYQGSDGAYIMIPDELNDVSIDTIAKSIENI